MVVVATRWQVPCLFGTLSLRNDKVYFVYVLYTLSVESTFAGLECETRLCTGFRSMGC